MNERVAADGAGDAVKEHIAVVEDDRELRRFLQEVLEEAGFRTVAFPTADLALEELRDDRDLDVVVTDLIMPGKRGHELLAELRRVRPEVNVIVITAFGSIDSAIELVKAGAYDYLAKPVSPDHLLLVVRRALEESRLRREVARLRRAAARPPPGFVGASRPMQEFFDLLRRAAESSQPVLLTGESGTGKEIAARAIHEISGRRGFVAVNCGALPENLVESELFGHRKGAFTGAVQDKPGLFEEGHRGTLFLDEIAELPLPLQPKLLRALEGGEIRRVGETRPREVEARVVTATNRDLEREVREGRFREDLYWRLNVIQLRVPSLRERPADIPLLAEHLVEQAARRDGVPRRPITPEAMALLTAYSWPGNVRELRNVIERAVALSASPEIGTEDLPARIREEGRMAALVDRATGEGLSLEDLERAYLLRVLREVGGNKSRAAEILGIDRKTLYRKLERLEGGEAPEDA